MIRGMIGIRITPIMNLFGLLWNISFRVYKEMRGSSDPTFTYQHCVIFLSSFIGLNYVR